MNRAKHAQCNDTDFAVLNYIYEFHEQYKNSPPVSLIMIHVKLSNASVYYSLAKLQKHYYIDWIYIEGYPVRFIVPAGMKK